MLTEFPEEHPTRATAMNPATKIKLLRMMHLSCGGLSPSRERAVSYRKEPEVTSLGCPYRLSVMIR